MRSTHVAFVTLFASAVVAFAACGGDANNPTGSGGGTTTPGAGGSGQSGGGSNVGAGTTNSGGSGAGTITSAGGTGPGGGGGGAGPGSGGGTTTSTTGSGGGTTTSTTGSGGGGPTNIQTVFLILMENHSWSTIHGSSSAPYINGLLTTAAHAEKYKTPAGNHPSEPNYIWLEAGDNLGITDDNPPSDNHQSTTNHLTTHLEAANISWKAYAEGISGTDCPLSDNGLYATKHTPQLFFDDMTNNGSSTSQHCIQHVRPYTELATDLTNGTVARYNFITPNLCDDMHGETFGTTCNTFFDDLIADGDTWLSTEVPKIMASSAYQNGGVIFILWDEGDESIGNASDGPIPLLVLSPFAKTGHASTIPYTHSSMLRSVQEIFGITPFIRDAANATDLSDLFTSFP